ncbi:MAG: chromosomal replication initiator DnaA [Cohaesibacter sp.]|nr:chromosomal replication initiator DnaA [Cohaesibacter sp.]
MLKGLSQRDTRKSVPFLLPEPVLTPEKQALNIIDELVARTFRLPKTALHSATRSRQPVAFARQIAMYLGHVCLSYRLRDVARHYRRDRTTISYACRVIEERREDENMELLLSSLESALETMKVLEPSPYNINQ